MKISSMNYLFKQGMKNIWTNRIMSVASFCILMVSLLLIGFTTLFIANINSFVNSIENKNEVIIFLEDGMEDVDIEQIGVKLNNMDNVSEVVFYSKEEAFEEIKLGIENSEELFSYVGEESPLPDSYRIKVKDIEKMGATLMDVNRLNGIDSINAPNDFATILTDLRRVISIISVVILSALIIVSLVIISNAERASVEIRKREIAIMKYVGATNTFIKVPFFVEGMTIGVFAGAVASVITIFGYKELAAMLSSEANMLTAMGITGLILPEDVIWKIILGYVVVGALLSASGTVMSTRKHLKV
ncbi:MAG: permease-like cell division protein FtsX [Oscillospiraceae bacterium]|nr:permease-like cell division protein FtsX [Oscillospiraceae bacterium]